MDLLLDLGLLEVVQQKRTPAPAHSRIVPVDVIRRRVSRRKDLEAIEVIVQRQSNLFEIVAALRAASRLARGLDRRHQNRYQDGDDGNHDKQFDQRKRLAARKAARLPLQIYFLVPDFPKRPEPRGGAA